MYVGYFKHKTRLTIENEAPKDSGLFEYKIFAVNLFILCANLCQHHLTLVKLSLESVS